jgi:hypothetical protein
MTKFNKILIILVLLAFQAGSAFAALNLSVVSVDGTNSLRLGRVQPGLDNKKELRVRVTSTDGVQYQVFQRLVGPIVNEKGESLDNQAIETATRANSNSSGTLYLQNIDRLGFGEQLLYTSVQSGPSDQFETAYALRPDLLNTTGNFSGTIAFTVRPIGGGSQQQVLVNLFLESSADWKASVEGSRIPGRVRIKDTDTADKPSDFVKISFSGNLGQEVRIYQEADGLPQNEMAEEVGRDVIQYSVAGNSTADIRVSDVAALDRKRVLIYSGNKSQDELLLYFLMARDKVQDQNAGIYSGRIKYIIETDKGQETFPIDLECQIQPVFTMDVDLPIEGVSFSNILPTTPAVNKEIQVRVRSNLHKPYQVMQSLISPMVNEKGNEVNKEYFTVQVVVPAGQKGNTRQANFVSMETGEYPIFYSDNEGSSATFKVVYRLQGYSQMSAGNYAAPIRYSLNQN